MTALLGAAAVVLWATSAFAQAKPNFAGTWVREAPAGGGGGGGGRGGGRGGWGTEPTITQTATELTVKWMQPGRQGGEPTPQTRTYKLDGTESKNPGGRGGDQISKAAWEGAKLVIKTSLGEMGESVMAISLDAGNLVIETTAPGREGTPTTSKVVYKKKA
jgi:hypothetical protein